MLIGVDQLNTKARSSEDVTYAIKKLGMCRARAQTSKARSGQWRIDGNEAIFADEEGYFAAVVIVLEGRRREQSEGNEDKRSEELRVGTECVSTCRSRWSQ